MIPLILLIAVVFFIYNYFIKKENIQKRINGKERRMLKIKYDEALKGNDKRYALECGRLYYASMRKYGILTIYDETALTNDLAAMDLKENK